MGKYVNGVYVPDPGETDNRFASSVQPHSRPLDAPVNEDGSVVRSSRLAQRNANQQARMAAAANSPVANNVQQVVDAAQVAPAGAVGNDSPDIQKANLFAKKYAPMLRGEEVKPAGEQLLADRTAKYQDQLLPKTPANTINPNSSSDGMDTILGHFTSPQEEEKYRKASVAQQRILAVADAIRQIGNIYNTTRYAPSQKLNMPAEAVRQRYLQDKALRDQANNRIISYQQAKAAQDLKARQLEAQQNRWEAEQKQKADQFNTTFNYNMKKDADALKERQRQYNETLALNKQKAEDARKHQEEMEKQGRSRIGIGYGNLAVAKQNAATNKRRVELLAQNGGRGGVRTNNGYDFSTKNGYITLPKDYLSKKNGINRHSLITEMERAGIIDDEWNEQYNIAQWTGKQDEMLDEAISDWLMTDDAAEQWLRMHLRGVDGGSVVPSSSSGNSGNGKKIYGTPTNTGNSGNSSGGYKFGTIK